MKRALAILLLLSAASAVGCSHAKPPPPPSRAPPPPPPGPAGIGVDQAKELALQFAGGQGFVGQFVFWVRDHGDKWEIRIHAPAAPRVAERRMTVWVDHHGNLPAFVLSVPGPGWAD